MINPTALRTVAQVVRKAPQAAKFVSSLPNGTLSMTVRQAKVMSAVTPKSSPVGQVAKMFAEFGEKLFGKKAAIEITKEASKRTPGGVIIRTAIKKGDKVVDKGVVALNPKTLETMVASSEGYIKLNPKAFDAKKVLDDVASSTSKKGGIVKTSGNVGEALKYDLKFDLAKIRGRYEKLGLGDILPNMRAKLEAALKPLQDALHGKAPADTGKYSIKEFAVKKPFTPEKFAEMKANIAKMKAATKAAKTEFFKMGNAHFEL